jgi:O-acetyl-ADP-ribose deacetylase (regulator of RNase III)
VRIIYGDLFGSRAQTWVNPVNCVGVMGKGLALSFRQRFPEMHADYCARCAAHQVRLGEPYLYAPGAAPWVLNFPTKGHWRERSRLDSIEAGLSYLAGHAEAWGITSLAMPALGCGAGQLRWDDVEPVIRRILGSLVPSIEVELYPPRPDAA